MYRDPAGLEELSGVIIGAAIEVHRAMGPGLLESIYVRCLEIELKERGVAVERRRRVPLFYRGHSVDYLEVDLVVAGCVVVEVKAVKELAPIHNAQTLSYLKLTGCPAGLLLNFHVRHLVSGLRRLSHPDLVESKKKPRDSEDSETRETTLAPLSPLSPVIQASEDSSTRKE